MKLALRTSRRPLSVADWREAARRALPDMVWAYVDGGADDCATLAANRAAFGRWVLRQRVLRGVGDPDLKTALEGTELAFPVLAAPTGLNGLSHPQGDIAVARGAEALGTRMILSAASSHSIEEVAGDRPLAHWFQSYPWDDRDLTGALIDRAARAGYAVLCLTVDVPALGNRERERRDGMGIPPVLTPRRIFQAARRPRWAYGFVRHRRAGLRNLIDAAGTGAGVESARRFQRQVELARFDWDDLAWVRARWAGPLYIKGVLEPEDALRAAELGVDGVVVSNHGGRQLDCAPAALDALPRVADAVGDRMRVIVDGGIRRGTDIVKALCLGANACLVGRPVVYGLAAGGASGVAAVLRILREEFERALVLMGASSVAELDRTWIRRRDADDGG